MKNSAGFLTLSRSHSAVWSLQTLERPLHSVPDHCNFVLTSLCLQTHLLKRSQMLSPNK
jgi:hypothetical protein